MPSEQLVTQYKLQLSQCIDYVKRLFLPRFTVKWEKCSRFYVNCGDKGLTKVFAKSFDKKLPLYCL